MSIKEKVNEIRALFYMRLSVSPTECTQCAILHVKGIIDELDSISTSHDIDLSDDIRYWQQILTELNKM